MQLIDTHCHLDVEEFTLDREEVLAHSRAAGVWAMVVPGIRMDGLPGLLALCRSHEGLYPALGLHPLYLEQHLPEHLPRLAELLARERPVAVGEIGLDFYIPEPDRKGQQVLFEAQLRLAGEAGLPVLLHVRKAHDQALALLRQVDLPGGIAHAFNGSLHQARQYIGLGFKLGFGGMLTYERSVKLRGLAKELPLEALVLETDAPDMTPAAHHGSRNSPEYLPEVAEALAALRGMPVEEVAAQTTTNAVEVLGLPSPG